MKNSFMVRFRYNPFMKSQILIGEFHRILMFGGKLHPIDDLL